ncbi:MAG: dTDP-4-dehydrorhamnose reductase [Ruminococcaceae bacterium]|nr:dTDP-4-dehydrorhamnose reductase [Oscillospiraceae bacterium]
MLILVTGVGGQLGYDVCRVLDTRGIQARGVDIDDFDITDRDAVLTYVDACRPDAIIHCSAYTAVDRAEDDVDACMRVNADGMKHLAEAAVRVGAKLLAISTDYVFAGEGDTFYAPDDPTAPRSVYGKSKALGESYIRQILDRHFIVRVSWLFGKNGNNFVKTMLRLAQTRTELNVVCDQIGSPTYSLDAAAVICDLVLTDRFGTYHVTNEGVCSWAEFAAEIMRQAGKETVIHPIPSSEYPARAPRPANSRLSKDKLLREGFSKLPHWKDALSRYLEEIKD